MGKVVIKIKHYQERVTYIQMTAPEGSTREQIITMGKELKEVADRYYPALPWSQNIIRIETPYGILNDRFQFVTEFV